MAQLIPSLHSCKPRMTAGERRLGERLTQKLEDDYRLWYDVPIGPHQSHPDFVILHPARGLLVLEVKDWKPETIARADRTQFHLVTGRGLVATHNPLLQARTCVLEVKMALERDPALRHPPGSRYAGKLVMPWAYGVVFSHLTRKQFHAGGLEAVIPAHLVICQDEMVESVDAETFQERLWAMFPQVFPLQLTLPQIDRIRWHLFPEVRVEPGDGWQPGLFASDAAPAGKETIPDLIRVMDAQQEQLARSLGSEHRIIHGVAGSGKTMILGFRAVHLAQALHKPILVLCYNKTLAARLEQLLALRGLADRVQVYNFHRWCRHMLVSYHEPLPANGTDFIPQLVEGVIDAVDRERIPRFQYGAILIDEGHDFEPDWYRLIVQMVDPATNSLLVLYDDAQNIYGAPGRRKTSWKSLGIQARGRTTILRINYRNTREILAVARAFAGHLLDERAGNEDTIPLLTPQSAGRRGPFPELVRTADEAAQRDYLTRALSAEHEAGRAWNDLAVLYRHQAEGEALARHLAAADMPCCLATGRGKQALFRAGDHVKLVSMHSSKGLEFPFVAIPHLGRLPSAGDDENAAARLLYVAMTRAMDHLLLLHSRESTFTRRIRASIGRVQAELAPEAKR